MKRYQNFQCKHYAPLWDDLYFSFSFFFFAHKNPWLCSGTCFIPGKSAATFPLLARQVQRVKGKDVEEMCKLNQIQRHYRIRLFLCSFAWMEMLPAELTARSEPRWLLLWRHVMRHHSMSRAKVQPAKPPPPPSFQVENSPLQFFGSTQTRLRMETHARATADGNINFLLQIPTRLCVV